MQYPPTPIPQIFIITFLAIAGLAFPRESHVINFRSPNLYPESLTWDPVAYHFIAGSLRNPILVSISSTAVIDTLISDPSLPANSCFLGVTVDPLRNRILAVVHSHSPLSSFNGLAAYDLRSRHRLFLTPLSDPYSTNTASGANDVAVDPDGNAYVTNSASNFIWKVNPEGERSVFSR